MSAVLGTIGKIAGTVAMIASVVPGGQPIAAIASAVAGFSNLGSSLLNKPPPARGSVTQLLIAPDPPQPYVMGEGFFAGVLRYQRSYGPTLDKVPNPYRFQAVVYSGGGPVQSISPRIDQAAIGSYYTGYLYTTTSLGACPDTALVPQWSGAPGWGTSSKLSGKAAIGWSLKFDKNGKVFANGMPQTGAYGQWVKVYDPRADSTRPGGSGSQRVNNEATWTWSANPALHAGTYAYGRYQNGKRVLGIGLPDAAIDWANVAAWANVCDANGWTLFGVLYEPGDRWANLRDICEAGAAQPVLASGSLYFHYQAPRVSLDTIGEADLLLDEEQGVVGRASWRDVLNTIVPKFRDPASNWELVNAGPVQVATYLAADGEVKQAEWPLNFVTDLDQAAQLARYRLELSRELQPIELVTGPRLRSYRPGDRLDLDLLDFLGLDMPAVIVRREFDPVRMAVRLTLVSDTLSHAFALGQTTTAPPVPTLGLTGQQRDELAAAATPPIGWASSQIRGGAIKNPRDTSDVARPLLTSTYSGAGLSNISVARHDWDYPGLDADTTRETYTFTGIAQNSQRYVYFDDETLVAGTVTYGLTTDPAEAQNSTANPYRHALGKIVTANSTSGAIDGGAGVGYGLQVSEYL